MEDNLMNKTLQMLKDDSTPVTFYTDCSMNSAIVGQVAAFDERMVFLVPVKLGEEVKDKKKVNNYDNEMIARKSIVSMKWQSSVEQE